ncbi:MAG: hypothetical protein EBU90_08315 [Proteobacteria bacterium]|nr:hypothetical protein [Pseudomonadota bacterium]
MLEKIFGPNWRSSTSGLVTVFAIVTAFAIHGDNTLVSFLPDKIEEYIVGFSKLIAVVSGIIFALTVKDSKVTGGSIPQTVEAENRLHVGETVGFNANIKMSEVWPPKKKGRKK